MVRCSKLAIPFNLTTGPNQFFKLGDSIVYFRLLTSLDGRSVMRPSNGSMSGEWYLKSGFPDYLIYRLFSTIYATLWYNDLKWKKINSVRTVKIISLLRGRPECRFHVAITIPVEKTHDETNHHSNHIWLDARFLAVFCIMFRKVSQESMVKHNIIYIAIVIMNRAWVENSGDM